MQLCAVKSNEGPEKVAAIMVGLLSRECHEGCQAGVGLGGIALVWVSGRRRKGAPGRGHSMNRHMGTQMSRVAGRTGRRRAWMELRPV